MGSEGGILGLSVTNRSVPPNDIGPTDIPDVEDSPYVLGTSTEYASIGVPGGDIQLGDFVLQRITHGLNDLVLDSMVTQEVLRSVFCLTLFV